MKQRSAQGAAEQQQRRSAGGEGHQTVDHEIASHTVNATQLSTQATERRRRGLRAPWARLTASATYCPLPAFPAARPCTPSCPRWRSGRGGSSCRPR